MGVGAGPVATDGSFDACCEGFAAHVIAGFATEVIAGSPAVTLGRNEHGANVGHLDSSISPREAEARKPKSLAAEDHAQQHRVKQQGEQQRKSELPLFMAHALT
jgi:hypothetical protein